MGPKSTVDRDVASELGHRQTRGLQAVHHRGEVKFHNEIRSERSQLNDISLHEVGYVGGRVKGSHQRKTHDDKENNHFGRGGKGSEVGDGELSGSGTTSRSASRLLWHFDSMGKDGSGIS